MKKLKENIAKSIYMKEYEKYGSIIFIIGILIALVSSVIPLDTLGQSGNKIVLATLIIFGLIIGIINITNKEAVPFLVAIIALTVLLGPFFALVSQNLISNINFAGRLMSYLIALLVPAAIIVAFKTLVITAKDE